MTKRLGTATLILSIITIVAVLAGSGQLFAADDCIPCERGLYADPQPWQPPICMLREGCVTSSGYPKGIVAEVDENFLSDALYNIFNAYKFTSPRGEIFLGDPADPGDDDLAGYVLSEPLALEFPDRALAWADRLPGLWDEHLPLGRNADDDLYPENDDNHFCILNPDPYVDLPLADDNPVFCTAMGGFHTFAAESCPEEFFDGLGGTERDAVRAMDLGALLADLESLPGWPDETTVEDSDTGIGPGAYDMILQFAVNLERAAHTSHSRYTFFAPGPNWLRILPPIVVVREPVGAAPYIEMRFGLIGVYNPLGCAKWYYDAHGDRVFDDSDIKVTWGALVVRAGLDLKLAADEGTITDLPTASSLQDSTKTWEPNEFSGARIRITSGIGVGKVYRITGNTADTLAISPRTWHEFFPPQVGDDYEILAPRIVLYFPDPEYDPGAFEFLEGNLNEGLNTAIEALTIDPDWAGTDTEWWDMMEDLVYDRQDSAFEFLPMFVSEMIDRFLDDFTIPLDFIWDNIGYLSDILDETLGVTFQDLGLAPDFLDSLRFKIWEETDAGGAHTGGLLGIGVDLMGEYYDNQWEVWRTNIIPTGKGFAAVVSNELLDSIASALIPSTGLPRPDGEALWFDLPFSIEYPREDPCKGEFNLIEKMKITNFTLAVPSSGTGEPRIEDMRGTVNMRIPWWVFLIGATLIAAALPFLIMWFLAWLGFTLLALGLLVMTTAIDLEITDLDVHSTAGSPPTAVITVQHEDSWPQLYANVTIAPGSVEIQKEFFPLSTILTPYWGIFFDLLIDDIARALWKSQTIPQQLFLTAFPISLNFFDTSVSDWLAGVNHDYDALTDGDPSTGPDTYPDLDTLQLEWGGNDLYRTLLWYLKLNHLAHFPKEFLAAGEACVPPDFYKLMAVKDHVCTDEKILIDQCRNYYEDGIDTSGDYDACEDYEAVCRLFSEAVPTNDDTFAQHHAAITAPEPDADEIVAEVFSLLTLTRNCDTVEWDLFTNELIQGLTDISDDEYKTAQAAMRCQAYGSYTPSANCEPNDFYIESADYLMDLSNQAMSDNNPNDGEADGMSGDEESELLAQGMSWIALAVEYAGEEMDPNAENGIDEHIEYIDAAEDCGGHNPPRDPQQGLWRHPWTDGDLDNDHWPRHCDPGDPCDCNDFDPTIYPGAFEHCNQADDDCDDIIDDGYDQDGDGYTKCDVPVPDCDDLDPLVNPGMIEIPGNGIDDDCDGQVDEDDCFLGSVL